MSTESHTDGETPDADPAQVEPERVEQPAAEAPQAESVATDESGSDAGATAADPAAADPAATDAATADPATADPAMGDQDEPVKKPKAKRKRKVLADEDPDMNAEPLELIEEETGGEAAEKHWYILKVQVNREGTIRDALERRVKIEGLEAYVDEIVVPTEDIAEFTKSGKRKITKRKLYPGYIMVNMVINDDTWFAVRETPGIGDFTGSAGKPTPMDPREVERILRRDVDEDEETQVKTSIPFNIGDHVRVKEGNFQNFEGDVDKIDEAHGLITVVINIFNRPTPVEIQYWQIEKV